MGLLKNLIEQSFKMGDLDPLKGAPTSANIPNVGRYDLGQSSEIIKSAEEYAREAGVDLKTLDRYLSIDPEFSGQVANEFGLMKHDPKNPQTKKAFQKLADETLMQYEKMLSDDVKPFFFGDLTDPYTNSPYESLIDLQDNKKLGVYSTKAGFGPDGFDATDNPLLQSSGFKLGGEDVLVNDAFRAVHDYYGHAKHGLGFRAAGEDNAYRAHSGMFSPEAMRAAATETRGQNSMLNYGPHGEANRTAKLIDTEFSEQKTGLLPNQFAVGRTPLGDERKKSFNDLFMEGVSGLEGAIDAQGNLNLTHYSRQPLDRIEPDRYGTGLSKRTKGEFNRLSSPDAPKRSFFGLSTDVDPYRKEQGLGQVSNQVKIAPEQMYDLDKDPDNLRKGIDASVHQSPQERQNQFEKTVQEKGYSGFFTNSPAQGKVAAMFDPMNVGKKMIIPLGVGAAASQSEDAQAGVISMALKKGLDPDNLVKTGMLKSEMVNNPQAVKTAQGKYKKAFEGKPSFRKAQTGKMQGDSKFTDTDIGQRKIIMPEDIVGNTLVPVTGDRSVTGRTIERVGGVDLNEPVRIEGGQDFPLEREGTGLGWASMKDKADIKQGNFNLASETGQDVMGVYSALGEDSVNFSTPIFEGMMKQVQQLPLTKADKKAFDNEFKKTKKDWVGLDHPDAMDQLMGRGEYTSKGAGKARTNFVNQMDKAQYRDQGFPTFKEMRDLANDQGLIDIPKGGSGTSIFQAKPFESTMPIDSHQSYDTGIRGDYKGGLIDSLPPQVMFPKIWQHLSQASNKHGDPLTEPQKIGSLMMNPKLFEKTDQQWLDNVSEYLHNASRQGKKVPDGQGGFVDPKVALGMMAGSGAAGLAFAAKPRETKQDQTKKNYLQKRVERGGADAQAAQGMLDRMKAHMNKNIQDTAAIVEPAMMIGNALAKESAKGWAGISAAIQGEDSFAAMQQMENDFKPYVPQSEGGIRGAKNLGGFIKQTTDYWTEGESGENIEQVKKNFKTSQDYLNKTVGDKYGKEAGAAAATALGLLPEVI